jgi:hypothetical protein
MSLGSISSAIGSAYLPGTRATSGTGASGARATSSASVASVNDQIRQDKQQLDDWTTCVSAKTTKGQAEIQRLSAELGGAESRAHRLSASQSRDSSTSSSHSIDVWA